MAGLDVREWIPLPSGRGWVVVNDRTGEFHKTRPCRYGPTGRVVTYRSREGAQRKADQLNAE